MGLERAGAEKTGLDVEAFPQWPSHIAFDPPSVRLKLLGETKRTKARQKGSGGSGESKSSDPSLRSG
jgi:hypothetical protein